jgi:hypothetical protein
MYRATYQGESIKLKAASIVAALDAAVRQLGVSQQFRHRVTVLPLDNAGRVIR